MKSVTVRRAKQTPKKPSASVAVQLVRLGDRARTLRVVRGTTIKDLVQDHGFERSSVRLNRRAVRLGTKLKSGDIVVVTPQIIAGASTGRYDHLGLDECRRRMSASDFEFFSNFVGAETLGVEDRDLEA